LIPWTPLIFIKKYPPTGLMHF